MTGYSCWIFCLLMAVSLVASGKEVQTVPSVDLDRYLGKWYEIARYPNGFQKACAGSVTATYSHRDDGQISVLNECRKADGKTKAAKGRAKVPDPAVPSKLRVTFFWPFYGDYWILDLGASKKLRWWGLPIGSPDALL